MSHKLNAKQHQRVVQLDDQIAQLQRSLRDYELAALATDDEADDSDLAEIENLELEILVLQQERDEITGE